MASGTHTNAGLCVLPTQPSPQVFCKPLLGGVNSEPEEDWPEYKVGGRPTHFEGWQEDPPGTGVCEHKDHSPHRTWSHPPPPFTLSRALSSEPFLYNLCPATVPLRGRVWHQGRLAGGGTRDSFPIGRGAGVSQRGHWKPKTPPPGTQLPALSQGMLDTEGT